ncbi:UDP-N-acetylmuramate dehydrogenase [Thiotrichales bacterium 19S3-7]|nr:UDP-N-acetylmuramate dehydrogenase [Thiotrichales bacterium 19S3-7]MCF6802890.1 UDP-N-acetylmuramate dehydrogenase [Thiotrichales bacterium 19S3-11]
MKGICNEYTPLKHLNTWRIGGKARYLYQPDSVGDLSKFLNSNTQNLPVVALGLGSNVLLYDGLINAIFVLFRNRLKHYQIDSDQQTITVGCGMPCPTVARKAFKNGFNNLNFLAGIPGTIGGALKMNAGAFGGEIWPEVVSVVIINKKGELSHRENGDIVYGYRSLKSDFDGYFVEATLKLGNTREKNAETSLKKLLEKRKEVQPVELASCGSVFKNPKGDFAARLIDECALKNYRVGDALISPKHANFIINQGNAKFSDVIGLMQYIYEQVDKKFAIALEPEVQIIGADGGYKGIW